MDLEPCSYPQIHSTHRFGLEPINSDIRFADEKVKKALGKLKQHDSPDHWLYEHIVRAFQTIRSNAFSGIRIHKRLIPPEYIRKYGIDNLLKYNLPKGWRLLYSIGRDETIILALILEWMNHKDYEKRFGY